MLIGLLSVASLCYIPWVIAIASSKYLNTLTLAFFLKQKVVLLQRNPLVFLEYGSTRKIG